MAEPAEKMAKTIVTYDKNKEKKPLERNPGRSFSSDSKEKENINSEQLSQQYYPQIEQNRYIQNNESAPSQINNFSTFKTCSVSSQKNSIRSRNQFESSNCHIVPGKRPNTKDFKCIQPIKDNAPLSEQKEKESSSLTDSNISKPQGELKIPVSHKTESSISMSCFWNGNPGLPKIQNTNSGCQNAKERHLQIINNLSLHREKLPENSVYLKEGPQNNKIEKETAPERQKTQQDRGLLNENQEKEKAPRQETQALINECYYKIFEHLGNGSFGEVVRELNLMTKKFHARKTLKKLDDKLSQKLAEQEHEALQAVQEAKSPILLKIYELKCFPKFLVRMELGYGTLHDFIDFCEKNKIDWSDEDILELFFQFWSQLRILKEIMLYHSDIKPKNTIISEEGFFLLADFGLSKKLKRTGKQMLCLDGTRFYFADDIKKAYDEGKKEFEFDPYEQDLHAIEEAINKKIIQRSIKPYHSLKELLIRKNITSEKDYKIFTKRESTIQIYEKHKEAYKIHLFNQLFNRYNLDEKYERLTFFIDYFAFEEFDKWLNNKLLTEKYKIELVLLYLLKAQNLQIKGKVAEALETYRKIEKLILDLSVKVISKGIKHQHKPIIDAKYIGLMYGKMALSARSNYDYCLAKTCIEKSIEINKHLFGPRNVELAENYFTLGSIEYNEGHRQAAVKYVEEALELLKSNNVAIDKRYVGIAQILGYSLEALAGFRNVFKKIRIFPIQKQKIGQNSERSDFFRKIS